MAGLVILAIDPGKINIGIAVIKTDDDLNMTEIISRTQYNRHIRKEMDNVYTHDYSFLAYRMGIMFDNLLSEFEPDIVTTEEPFISRFALQGGIDVAKGLTALESSVEKYNMEVLKLTIKSDLKVPIIHQNPRVIKLEFTGDGSADKDKMWEQFLKEDELLQLVDIDTVSEHSLDAIAMGAILLKKIKLNPLIIL